MSEQYLKALEPDTFLWYPACQYLNDLVDRVSIMKEKPKSKQLLTDEELDLKIVILNLIRNHAYSMGQLNKKVAKLNVETNKGEECH